MEIKNSPDRPTSPKANYLDKLVHEGVNDNYDTQYINIGYNKHIVYIIMFGKKYGYHMSRMFNHGFGRTVSIRIPRSGDIDIQHLQEQTVINQTHKVIKETYNLNMVEVHNVGDPSIGNGRLSSLSNGCQADPCSKTNTEIDEELDTVFRTVYRNIYGVCLRT